ncbi:MAG: hypothetical protein AB7K52_05505 [Phycisphaerales bacterium]
MSKILGRLALLGGVAALATVGWTASAALAQASSGSSVSAAAPARQTTGDPRRDTLLKMQIPVTIDLNDTPLEDVMKFVVDATGADIEPLWTTDIDSEGLSKDAAITMSVKAMPALLFLEKLSTQLEGGSNRYSWQMDPEGVLQFGPKARLNRFKRVEIYDINDLLFILPVYDNAPQIDLNQVLQQAGRGGGGGGRSPFRENQNRNRRDDEPPTKEERAKKIQDIITQIIEPEEWFAGGGEGGAITYHEGTLIVNAADYLHRQVNGYKWWPTFRASSSSGRRYVQLNIDTGISQLERPLRTVPTSAVVGGQVITSPPGGGG